jgi:MFS family permease
METKNPRSPLVFIFLTVFLDLLGAGIILPLLPFYVKIVEQADDPTLVAYRALIVGALAASFSFFQFIFAPVLGALSDRYGRRPVLLLSLLGAGLSYVLFALAGQFQSFGVEAVLAVLFAGRILAGITGGNISTAQAYIADVTSPQERARSLGMIGAAFGLGFMIGPALGGILSHISLEAPAFAAAALAFGNVIFGYFMLPESLPAERRTRTVMNLNPLTRLQALVGKRQLRPLLAGVVMLNFAFAGLQNNFAVYTDARFGFGPDQNAWLFAFLGLVAVFVQGFLIRRLLPRFGEARLAITGMVVMMIAFILLTIAPQAWMLYPVIGLLAFGSGIATPSTTALISRRVTPQEQGSTLGGVQALISLTMVVGPLFAGYVFDTVAITAPYSFGAAFVAVAAAILISALLPDLRGSTSRVESGQTRVGFDAERGMAE